MSHISYQVLVQRHQLIVGFGLFMGFTDKKKKTERITTVIPHVTFIFVVSFFSPFLSSLSSYICVTLALVYYSNSCRQVKACSHPFVSKETQTPLPRRGTNRPECRRFRRGRDPRGPSAPAAGGPVTPGSSVSRASTSPRASSVDPALPVSMGTDERARQQVRERQLF